MIKRDPWMGVAVVVGAMAGVFLGAGADLSWAAISEPQYIFGSVVAGAAAFGGWRAKSPGRG